MVLKSITLILFRMLLKQLSNEKSQPVADSFDIEMLVILYHTEVSYGGN